MIVYILVYLFISLGVFWYEEVPNSDREIVKKQNKYIVTNRQVFLFCCTLVLIVLSSIRGDFTADYAAYTFDYNRYLGANVKDIFSVYNRYEPLYALLNYVLANVFKNPISLFAVCSIIIVGAYVNLIKKESVNIALSLVLFVTVGVYYPSFNTMRQVLAAAIFSMAIPYVYRGDFKRYAVIVIVATLFHKISILMIPIYFILRMKVSLKNNMILFVGTGVVSALYELIATRLNDFLGFSYSFESSTSSGMQGSTFKSVVVYIFIGLFVLICSSWIKDSPKKNVNVNGTLIWTALYFLSMNLNFSVRLAYYFCPFMLLSVPAVLRGISNKRTRNFATAVIVFLLFVFFINAYSGSKYNPYYTIFS